MLTKPQSVFDAATVTDGDSIASYLFATNRLTSAAIGGNESLRTIAALQDGAGTALTSTLVSGKQSLDVNVASFSATDLHVDGTVADGTTDADNPVKIGGQAYSTLTAGTAGKRYNAAFDLYRRLYVNNGCNIAAKVATATVGITAATLGAALAGRKNLILQNNGTKTIYIGFDATVTADTAATGGLQIPGHGGTLEVPAGDNVGVFAISGTAAQKLAVYELA